MPQDPFLIDQIQIEPSEAGTRLINRAADGSLQFTDALIVGGITLQQLAGLGSIGNVLVVGKSGAGAKYTTIQSALDAVPSAASAANPYIVLVLPGVYTETVNIVRDGVQLIGIGKPVIESALEATPDAPGNDHTVIISAQLGTIPLSTLIQGFTITNAHTNKACVRIVGAAASTVGSTGILIKDCDLQANSAAGNRYLWATAVNIMAVIGGVWSAGSNLGLLLIQEVAQFTIDSVVGLGAVDLRYDTANDVPAAVAVGYRMFNCDRVAADSLVATKFACDLDGAGSFLAENTHLPVQANFSGDQAVVLRGCTVATLNLLETTTLTALGSTIQALLAPNATAVLDIPKQTGTAVFAAATQVDVTFDVPMSDDSYQVHLEVPSQPVNDETPWITAKAVTGFRINFATNQTMNVGWSALRYDV
jgi:hypothetical protein